MCTRDVVSARQCFAVSALSPIHLSIFKKTLSIPRLVKAVFLTCLSFTPSFFLLPPTEVLLPFFGVCHCLGGCKTAPGKRWSAGLPGRRGQRAFSAEGSSGGWQCFPRKKREVSCGLTGVLRGRSLCSRHCRGRALVFIPALALAKLLPHRTETWWWSDLTGLRLDLANTEHVPAACRTPQQRPSPWSVSPTCGHFLGLPGVPVGWLSAV